MSSIQPTMPPIRKLFDIQPRPPYPHRPIFTPRRTKVTTGIGILPLDGHSVILATDSKYTSQITYPGEKVFPLRPRDHFKVVIAAAGIDADFMKISAQDIDQALPQTSDPVPIDRVVSQIKEREKLSYKRSVLPLLKAKVPDYKVPEYSFLIAIWCSPKELRLLKSYRGSISQVDKYDFIGTGGLIAQAYEQRLGQYRTDEFEASLLAVYWVKKAKTRDPDSGGDTYLYVLTEDGELNKFDSVYVDCAEQHFDELEKLFDSIVIPSTVGDEEMLEDILDKRGVSSIKRCRQDLLRMYQTGACYRRLW